MNAVLHYTDLNSPAIGLWFKDPEQPTVGSVYLQDESDERTRASLIMSTKNPDLTWEEFFDHLAGRQPYFEVWETADIGMAFTPQEYLEMMVKIANSRLKRGA